MHEMKAPYSPVRGSCCYSPNNPVLPQCLVFCSTSFELLVIERATPFLRGASVVFRIKGRALLHIFSEKAGCYLRAGVAKRLFGPSLPVLAPRACSTLSLLELRLHHLSHAGWDAGSLLAVLRGSAAQVGYGGLCREASGRENRLPLYAQPVGEAGGIFTFRSLMSKADIETVDFLH